MDDQVMFAFGNLDSREPEKQQVDYPTLSTQLFQERHSKRYWSISKARRLRIISSGLSQLLE
ncbi:hypothetical protein BDV38DRAFT_235611 [Aspergillus pseudotamarii]|uniref:Uncharacterized protein n=1 Tax=Aspergillus pseudotamarii TaxID=132259 RepID=A0A5N6T8W4_ASPPS|nr:uncharacterized protein BDV38DRAFT_235611 [Aspergillus pseudotamarii]KAE8142720.1 hypothetical protein BDV38DRAFT_235611 [Aspergillus pseudotamarii]